MEMDLLKVWLFKLSFLMKCHKTLKNVDDNFQEFIVASSNCLFCTIIAQKQCEVKVFTCIFCWSVIILNILVSSFSPFIYHRYSFHKNHIQILDWWRKLIDFHKMLAGNCVYLFKPPLRQTIWLGYFCWNLFFSY